MDTLFNHPGFRLIFIDDNGNMSLEGPFDKSRENVLDNGYRCISHVWKTGDGKDYVWKDHGITNVTWKVEIRKEKHERLLQIFNHHKGYFWMDVFCTNQDDDNKPLDVMGDIYRNCMECICLFDTICRVDGFTSERDVLTSLAKDVRERTKVAKDFYEKHKRYGKEFSGGRVNYLKNLSECDWFNRVWTWQEAVLPPKLFFCSEQAGEYRYDPFDQEFLKELFPYKSLEAGFTAIIGGNMSVINEMDQLKEQDENLFKILKYLTPITDIGRKHSIYNDVMTLHASERECTDEQDYVYGIMGILNIVVPKSLTLDKAIIEFDKSLQRQGIFIEEADDSGGSDRSNINILGDLLGDVIPIDGIIVLGRVDDDAVLKFNPGIVRECESHGKILSKGSHDDFMYEHICWEYVTETSIIYLETDEYNIGDVLETTKIGREGCTFQCAKDGYKEDEIFEMTDDRVRTIGHIGNSMSKLSKLLSYLDSSDDNYEE